MPNKQSDDDKALAIKEYHDAWEAAIQRIARLRAARLARDAAAEAPTKAKSKKPIPK